MRLDLHAPALSEIDEKNDLATQAYIDLLSIPRDNSCHAGI
jgi:hypothetical protein